MYLLVIRGGATKANLLKFMLEMEVGKHTNIPGVEIIPVKAMRLIPEDTSQGHMTIDGESIPVAPIQAQSMPSTAKIFIK